MRLNLVPILVLIIVAGITYLIWDFETARTVSLIWVIFVAAITLPELLINRWRDR